MRVRSNLSHQDSNQFVARIDPEHSAEGTAPSVGSDCARHAAWSQLGGDRVAESESESRAAQPDRLVAGVIRSHQPDRSRAEDADTVQFAAVEHHLMEAEVVR